MGATKREIWQNYCLTLIREWQLLSTRHFHLEAYDYLEGARDLWCHDVIRDIFSAPNFVTSLTILDVYLPANFFKQVKQAFVNWLLVLT